jgi:hypothetical protein
MITLQYHSDKGYLTISNDTKKAHLSGFSAEYPTLYNPKVFSFELQVAGHLLKEESF